MIKWLLIWWLVLGTWVWAKRDDRHPDVCTSVTYGFPFPWIIQNCECDGKGGLIEYDNISNPLFVLIGGIVLGGASHFIYRRISNVKN